MQYTQQELAQARQELKKRRLVTFIPFALLAAAAVAACIVCQQARMETAWLITGAFVIVAGAYLIFLWDVYLRPVKAYTKNIDIMLNGRLRETTGVLKELSPDLCDRDFLKCRQVWINVGEKNLDEDDRLFYLEQHKSLPDIPLGTKVKVTSNDKMISRIDTL